MIRKYRIKRTCKWYRLESFRYRYMPTFFVQMKLLFFWVTIKKFFDMFDPDFARREAEELLDKLNEE